MKGISEIEKVFASIFTIEEILMYEHCEKYFHCN